MSLTRAPSEARLWTDLWPLLLASAVGLFPFTVYSTFLVPIADAAGGDVAAVGALRGLGGICALAVGVAIAPLLERYAKRRLSAVALAALAAGSLAALHGSYVSLVVFCAAIGAATALLTPALLAAAAERYEDAAIAGRAATLVTAAQSLAAVAAGPVIGLIATQTGWRGALIATAATAAALAAAFALRADPPRPPESERPPTYLAAFRTLAARADLLGLIAVAALRTAVFMGCLAYLAAWFAHAFDMSAALFTLVWTLSGLSFFLGNYIAGKRIGTASDAGARKVMLAGIGAAGLGLAALFTAPGLPVALAATAVHSAGHAVTAAAVTALIVRRSGPLRAAALSVNAAGMSLGVFAGAALGGAGLAAWGYGGIALALGLPLAVALVIAARGLGPTANGPR